MTEAEATAADSAAAEAVLAFWFGEGDRKAWFAKDAAFDATIRERFGAFHAALAEDPGRAAALASTPRGALAAVLVLDQFSRNLFRDDARAFAQDETAREIARRAIARGDLRDPALPSDAPVFLVLPFEHSEHLADQDWCVALCETLGDADYLDYAHKHRDIIRRFARFPHRNAALGRESTAEERDFLTRPGSSF
jgi:uncharacterized protein (DUF924 family)